MPDRGVPLPGGSRHLRSKSPLPPGEGARRAGEGLPPRRNRPPPLPRHRGRHDLASFQGRECRARRRPIRRGCAASRTSRAYPTAQPPNPAHPRPGQRRAGRAGDRRRSARGFPMAERSPPLPARGPSPVRSARRTTRQGRRSDGLTAARTPARASRKGRCGPSQHDVDPRPAMRNPLQVVPPREGDPVDLDPFAWPPGSPRPSVGNPIRARIARTSARPRRSRGRRRRPARSPRLPALPRAASHSPESAGRSLHERIFSIARLSPGCSCGKSEVRDPIPWVAWTTGCPGGEA